MKALEWTSLLLRAEAQWKEFSEILISRAPDDERLSALRPRVPLDSLDVDDVTENAGE